MTYLQLEVEEHLLITMMLHGTPSVPCVQVTQWVAVAMLMVAQAEAEPQASS